MIVAITGPSGAGKTTIAGALAKATGWPRVVTYTTRPQRDGENDGSDYCFVDEREFADLQRRCVFAECDDFDGNRYGTPKASIERDCIAVLTGRGVLALRESGYPVFWVAIEADPRVCEQRLASRDGSAGAERTHHLASVDHDIAVSNDGAREIGDIVATILDAANERGIACQRH